MSWTPLTEVAQLSSIALEKEKYSLIFKHSSRCFISTMAKRNLDQALERLGAAGIELYFLDLIAHRALSNEVATHFQEAHQSPQILLIQAGHCILEASHGDISVDEILDSIA